MKPTWMKRPSNDTNILSSSEANCVLLLTSIHQVMKAEKLLKGQGMKVDLIPMPREISSDCGVAIKISSGKKKEALSLLRVHHLSVLGTFIKRLGRYEQED